MAAINCSALTNVVLSCVGISDMPFPHTTEPETNPEPVTVRLNPGLPAITDMGDIVVMV